MTFQMIVLWIAVLIFIATLGFIGYSIYTSQYNISWPPSIPDCPDYWTVSSADGVNFVCNSSNYNKCGSLTTFPISSNATLCDNFEFASKNKCPPSFNWSGVTNSLKCRS
jgi:hypothetical protein